MAQNARSASRSRSRARNGSGTVTPRLLADGKTRVYDALTPKVYDPTQERERRIPKRGHKSEQAAQEWINQTVRDLENGRKVIERRGGPTVDEVVEGWAKTSTLKNTTVAGYRGAYEWLAQGHIGRKAISKLRGPDIDELLSTLRQEYTAASVALLCRALVSVWEYALRAGKVNANYAKESPWVGKIYQEVRDNRAEKVMRLEEDSDEGLIKVFTPEQTQIFLQSDRRKDYRRLFEFIVTTGARRGEALGLRWEDVDLERGIIWLSENHTFTGGRRITASSPKGNRRRRIFIAPEVVELLREQWAYLEARREYWGEEWKEYGLVFPRAEIRPRGGDQVIGGHQDPNSVTGAFTNRCRRYGLPEITLHGLRHTCATAMLLAGVDIKTIQKHMGHRLDITTLVYLHPDSRTQREAVTRVVDYVRAT